MFKFITLYFINFDSVPKTHIFISFMSPDVNISKEKSFPTIDLAFFFSGLESVEHLPD